MNDAVHDPSAVRVDEAQERFHALIQARMRTPFAWGEHDCVLWAADAVHAITGDDPAAEYRGTYSTATGAARLLQELGGLEALADRYGERCPPLAARPGDVGIVVGEDGHESMAVCSGLHWLAVTKAGLGAQDLGAARLAWRISRG